jgi:hypothetical protein
MTWCFESIEEHHHTVKWVLSEVEHMDPHEESFDAKVTVLIEKVRTPPHGASIRGARSRHASMYHDLKFLFRLPALG